jgi:hypothetical protein
MFTGILKHNALKGTLSTYHILSQLAKQPNSVLPSNDTFAIRKLTLNPRDLVLPRLGSAYGGSLMPPPQLSSSS